MLEGKSGEFGDVRQVGICARSGWEKLRWKQSLKRGAYSESAALCEASVELQCMVSCDAVGHHPFLFLPSGVQLTFVALFALSHHF